MPTLNRFPLLGLWAKEAARRIGYSEAEAEALGHAYAVLYAIRAQRVRTRKTEPKEKAAAKPPRKRGQQLHLFGDDVEVTYDAKGRVQGLVGGEKPQTAKSYQASVAAKFPAGYYDKLQSAFRKFFANLRPAELDSRLVYDVYDEWKKGAGAGRLVKLDELLAWIRKHAPKSSATKPRKKSKRK